MSANRAWLLGLGGILLALLVLLLVGVRTEERNVQTQQSTFRSDSEGCRALFLLAKRLGFEPKRVRQQLRLLPERGRLLFLLGLRQLSTPEVNGVLAWVREGGTLVLSGKRRTRLHQKLGISLRKAKSGVLVGKRERRKVPKAEKGSKTPKDSAFSAPPTLFPPSHPMPTAPKKHDPHGANVVSSPTKARQELWLPGKVWLTSAHKETSVLYATGGKSRLVTFAQGKGRVFVVSSNELFTNKGLRQKTNVWFVANLLRLYAENQPVLFAEHHHGYRYERTFLGYLKHRRLDAALYQLLLGLALLFWWGLVRVGRLRKQPSHQAQQGDHVDALAQLYHKAEATEQAASLLAWDLREALQRSIGRRQTRDPLLAILALQRKGVPQASEIPPLLQTLESIALGQHPVEEEQLLAYASQIDTIKFALSQHDSVSRGEGRAQIR